jgi:tetratricopeptide (TPR) repeat protein
LYLRAKEIWRDQGTGGEQIDQQVPLLDEAVARDPAVVPALCMLAELHLLAYFENHDHTAARLELGKKRIEAAERLRPDAGEVHRARGMFYYFGPARDYDVALAELALAKRSSPNDAEVLGIIGAIEARQGHWKESLQSLERSHTLDPRNTLLAGDLTYGYFGLKRYADVRHLLDKLRVWKPEDFTTQLWRAALDVHENADLNSIRKLLASEGAAKAGHNLLTLNRRWVAYLSRDYRAAEEALAQYPLADISFDGAVVPREYYEGRAARGLHDGSRAETAFLRARRRAAANVATRPADGMAMIWLAKIDAMLGRKADAIREGERAAELLPVAQDALDGVHLLLTLVEVYAEAGETNPALKVLEEAAALPHGPSYGILQLDEDFDPLRSDPRFQKIVASLAPKSSSH